MTIGERESIPWVTAQRLSLVVMIKQAILRRGIPSTGAVLLGIALVGCQASQSESAPPLRSPTLDYPAPAPTTADGRSIGADEKPPGDRLQEGARVGTDPALAPGWEAHHGALTYDPKRQLDGAVDPGPSSDPHLPKQPDPSPKSADKPHR
ncbi:MAG TPA: hypothetical protein VIV60_17325 [Polyangiaceae bacterium]